VLESVLLAVLVPVLLAVLDEGQPLLPLLPLLGELVLGQVLEPVPDGALRQQCPQWQPQPLSHPQPQQPRQQQ
jgi:hypothetical protein